jgi:type I restriction enzyme, S subunit
MTNGWRVGKFGDVLEPVSRPVQVEPDKVYRNLGVQWYAKGLFVREEKPGYDIRAKELYQVEVGDLVYNRLFAWKGSFAIAEEDTAGGFVSGEFPCFHVDANRADPKYLHLYLSQEKIWQEIERISTGQTSISRLRLKEPMFLGMEIPLPPLTEQRRIVAHIESLAARVNEAQRLREEADIETNAFIASAKNTAFLGLVNIMGLKSNESANELLARTLRKRRAYWEETIRAKGKDPSKANYEEPQKITLGDLPALPENWCWVSWDTVLSFDDGAFRRGPFGSTLRKSIFVESGYKVYEQYCPINDDCSFGRYYITPEMFKKLKSFEVKVGDYLISCSGVTLGRITRVPEGSEEGVINQALLRVRINEQIIDPDYFKYCFRAPFFQKMLFANSTGSAIPNLKGVKELKAIPLPLPPLDEQRRIVAYLDGLQAKVNALRGLQSASGEELSALMPSILDRAFKGEL